MKLKKILVKLSLSLLVIAFVSVVFVGAFKSNVPKYAIKVGDIEYSYSDWDRILKNNIQPGVSLPDLKNNLVMQIVNSSLLYNYGKDLGVLANDEAVKNKILKIEAFSEKGKFNKSLFQKIMKDNGLSEDIFVKKIKADLVREIFLDSFSLPSIYSSPVLDLISNKMLQKRKIEVFDIPTKIFDKGDNPKYEDLREIYDSNKDLFIVPESKNISYIIFSKADVGDIKIDDKKLKKLYDEKSNLFLSQEYRSVTRLKFNSIEKAKIAKEEIDKGVSFDDLAKKYELKTLKKVKYSDFSDDIANIIFSLKLNENSKIIETPIGYCIFHIKEIYEYKPSFFDMKETLMKKYTEGVKAHKFSMLLRDIRKSLEEAKGIDYIANAYQKNIKKIIIYKGEKSSVLNQKKFREVLFNENDKVRLVELDEDQFCLYRVDNVINASYKSFESVKKDLREIWSKNNIISQVKKFKDKSFFIKLLKQKGYALTPKEYIISRESSNNIIQPALVLKLFSSSFAYNFIDNNYITIAFVSSVIKPERNTILKYNSLYADELKQIEYDSIRHDILLNLRKKYEIYVSDGIFQ